jgi:hypothetical protein
MNECVHRQMVSYGWMLLLHEEFQLWIGLNK